MKTALIKLAAVLMLGTAGVSALAAPVSISSYDMTGVYYNNFGYYDGQITSAGNHSYTYTGGSGTINDGQIAPGNSDAYLFYYDKSPTITLHLGELAAISSLRLFSFEQGNNVFNGSIAGLNVTINGETRFISTEGFGPPNYDNTRDHVHEYLSLAGSGLENLITDTIILSGFVVDSRNPSGMYISEISIDGLLHSAGTVSEPAGLVLLAGGLMGLGMIRRRKGAVHRAGI